MAIGFDDVAAVVASVYHARIVNKFIIPILRHPLK